LFVIILSLISDQTRFQFCEFSDFIFDHLLFCCCLRNFLVC